MEKIILPIEPYSVRDDFWKFGDKVPRRWGLWARHLGDDVVVDEGTSVHAIGVGEVVLNQMLKGSEKKRSWGGVVIIKHDPAFAKASAGKQTFFSIYGHMKDVRVNVGEQVEGGQVLGEVAGSFTPENGWWKIPHLHFGIYSGPWRGNVLPGYWRPEKFWRTKKSWWHDPQQFIDKNNSLQVGK